MHDLVLDGIQELVRFVQAQKYQEAKVLIQQELKALRAKAGEARRTQVDVLIRHIFNLDRQIEQLEQQYRRMSEHCPIDLLDSVDEYIAELKRKKVDLEVQKKGIARGK